MWTFVLFGLAALLRAAPVQDRSDWFAGVVHIERSSQNSFTFQQALDLCLSLGYNLATEEQMIEAYKNGLRTCRYGWIQGQVVMFLPRVNGQNCESSSSAISLHSKDAETLSGVYCFSSSDRNTTEDAFNELKIEGFLVDMGHEDVIYHAQKPAEMTFSHDSSQAMKSGPDLHMILSKSMKSTEIKEDSERHEKRLKLVKRSSSGAFDDSEGSGSTSFMDIPKTRTIILNTEPTDEATSQYILEEEIKNNHAPKLNAVLDDVEADNPDENPPPPSKQKSASPWLIIFAFCVVVGAIVCLLVAFATKDKWYGPRKSKNITPEEYSKVGTLPLSEKEQEIVSLMSVSNIHNDKRENPAGDLKEHEKEYLM